MGWAGKDDDDDGIGDFGLADSVASDRQSRAPTQPRVRSGPARVPVVHGSSVGVVKMGKPFGSQFKGVDAFGKVRSLASPA